MPWGLGLGQAFVPIEYVPMIVPVGEIFVTLLLKLFAVHILVPSKAMPRGTLPVPENAAVAPAVLEASTTLDPVVVVLAKVPLKVGAV